MSVFSKKNLYIAPIIFAIFSINYAYGFDLIDAWSAAKEYDASFSASQHERDAGEEKSVQGRAQLLPQISANANYYQQNPIKPNNPKYETNGWNINLTQPIFDIGKYSSYRQGKIQTQIAQTKFSIAEQNLISDTAKAYFAVLLAYDTLSATRSAKEAYAKELEQAKLSFRIGTSTIIDTDEAQAHYDSAITQEILAQTNLKIAAGALQQITGLNPRQIQLVDGKKVLDFPKEISLDDWQKIALKNSLTLKNSEYALALAKQELLTNQGSNWPKINLSANYNNGASIFKNLPSDHTRNTSIGVELSLPIFSGGRINSQIKEAAELKLQAQDNLESTRRQLKEDIRSAYLNVTSGIAQVKSIEQLLKSTKSTLESTRLGKKVGVRSNLDLLKAEQNYYETIRSLSQSRYTYLLARLNLAQVAGILEPTSLSNINKTISTIEADQLNQHAAQVNGK